MKERGIANEGSENLYNSSQGRRVSRKERDSGESEKVYIQKYESTSLNQPCYLLRSEIDPVLSRAGTYRETHKVHPATLSGGGGIVSNRSCRRWGAAMAAGKS